MSRPAMFGISLFAGMIAMAGTAGAATTAASAPNAATGTVASITTVSAVASGSVNAEGSATSWYYQFGPATVPTYGQQTTSTSAGSGTGTVHVSRTISGLSPATAYHLRIVASSATGTTYGADVSFNTLAAPVVVTGAATNLTPTSATLNAIVNPEALATSWYFEYGLSIGYGSKSATHTLVASPNNSLVTAAVTKLASNATYHFRVVAKSSAGTVVGNDLVLITGQSVTLNSSAVEVVAGSSANLSGALTSGVSGQSVEVLSRRFDTAAFTMLTSTTTTTGGIWHVEVQPAVRTTYEATITGSSSSPLVISVAPLVTLNLVAGGQLATRVSGETSFANHVLQLQRLENGLWVTWKHVRLNSKGQSTFATALPVGRTVIRMAIAPFVAGIDQAAPGYLAGYSRSLSYRH